MQEEINQKSIGVAKKVMEKAMVLSFKATKATADELKKAMLAFLGGQKNGADKSYRGKQSVKNLLKSNTGVSNIEITDDNIKSFERVAKKYGVDFALKKDSNESPPKYLVFFKGRDVDVINQAFKEYTSGRMKQASKPSLIKQLNELKEAMKNLVPQKVKNKDKGREL